MPFKSEAQRRYLWANEPEIARDWTDTYGSKIHAANGGIMRLGFDNGGDVIVDENKLTYEESPYRNKYTEDEFNEVFGEETIGIGGIEGIKEFATNVKDKFTGGVDYMKKLPSMAIGALAGIPGLGLATQAFRGQQLTPQQIQMNKNYMANYGVTRDQTTGRMIGGPFQGMNAPGQSAFGSRTSKEMAQKWMNKYGEMDYQTPEQQQKQQTIKNIATMNQGPAGIIPQAPTPQGPTPAQMNMGSGNRGQHTTQGRDRGRSRGSGDTGQISGGHHFYRGGIAGIWLR